MARVACETMVTTGMAIVSGEITTDGLRRDPRHRAPHDQRHRLRPRVDGLRRQHLRRDDLDRPAEPRHRPGRRQGLRDPHRRAASDEIDDQGAGDQGMMFGYACDENDAMMPTPIHLAHRLAERLAEVRKAGILPYLRPDSKTQVTIDYVDGKPDRLTHRADLDPARTRATTPRSLIKPDLIEQVIRPTLPEQFAGRRLQGPRQPHRRSSSSAAPTPTAASPAARSSSTPTAAGPATAAARSRARTRPRSTARPPTPPAGSPRTSSPPAPPAGARCRWPTPSAWPTPCRSWSRPSAPRTSTRVKIVDRRARGLRPPSRRHPPRPRPAPADLPQDRGLRALRPHRRARRVPVGEPRPGRRPEVGPRPVEPRRTV